MLFEAVTVKLAFSRRTRSGRGQVGMCQARACCFCSAAHPLRIGTGHKKVSQVSERVSVSNVTVKLYSQGGQ